MNPSSSENGDKRLPALVLAAIGVVYGDIGTSPLYAIKECFGAEHGIPVTQETVFGVLSLLFWALLVIVSIKYLVFVLRADNDGEGGILALMALALRGVSNAKGRWWIAALGMFGAAMFYGDGMITPAISVLSAVEGLEVATPWFSQYVLPITLVILFVLFFFQRHGTAVVGQLFGPITCVWFVTLAVLGVYHIAQTPEILSALSPHYGFRFALTYGWQAFIVLGSVFLAVTGAEALYADMGHFGAKAIRIAWFGLAMPSLLLNYFGQGALILQAPESIKNPFYMMAPEWGVLPLVVIATFATVIASQAVITGAFSLTRQAILMGYCPRMKIVHTSDQEIGQIYIPAVNWMLLVSVAGLVLYFRNSGNLAAAYGIAVTTTMVITTILAYIVMIRVWKWDPVVVVVGVALFLIIDIAFFSANAIKISEGGWFPIAIGAFAFVLLSTWKRGRAILLERLSGEAIPVEIFLESLQRAAPQAIEGTAVFMSSSKIGIPHAFLHNLKHNKALHQRNVILTISFADIPFVEEKERIKIDRLGDSVWRIGASYGFKESPNIAEIFSLCEKYHDIAFDMMDTSFFLTHEILIASKARNMAIWRKKLYAMLAKNATKPTDFFGIPTNRVVELGAAVEL
jgi:KUP system potassium uptake protein